VYTGTVVGGDVGALRICVSTRAPLNSLSASANAADGDVAVAVAKGGQQAHNPSTTSTERLTRQPAGSARVRRCIPPSSSPVLGTARGVRDWDAGTCRTAQAPEEVGARVLSHVRAPDGSRTAASACGGLQSDRHE